jgi:type II secretory pathway pseudopilin PulG
MKHLQPEKHDAGSVLIESVISAAIIAMILGTGCNAIGNSLNRSRTLEDQQRALLVAQSQLALLGPVIPPNYGQKNGVDHDLAFKVSIDPYTNENASGSETTLVQVTVEVFKGDPAKRLAQLRSLRFAGGR